MRPTRRRRPALAALCIPAAFTGLLWVASHLWYFWYCSLPSGTQIRNAPTQVFATKVRVYAGVIHYTNDTEHERDTRARMNSGTPFPPGTISLGTMMHKDGTAYSGLTVDWSPTGLAATRWRPQLHAGNWGFPLAIPLAILLTPPLGFWLLTRPRKTGNCPRCGYNLAGLPSPAHCPECGVDHRRSAHPVLSRRTVRPQ